MKTTRRNWIKNLIVGSAAWALTLKKPQAQTFFQGAVNGAGVNISVLQPSDFTYLGYSTLPTDLGADAFAFSHAVLSGRIIGGDTHLFISQADDDIGGGTCQIAEIKYNGVGARAALVTNWGDVTKGKRVAKSGNGCITRGLFWDPIASQIWSAYGDYYNVAGNWDPSLITSTLTGSDNTGVTAYGPWRTAEISQKTRGYIFALPSAMQSALSGMRLAVGAPITSGNSGSPWGAMSMAFVPPSNATPADVTTNEHVSVPGFTFLYSDISNKQSRPDDCDSCGWVHYGESNGMGHEPQNNPVQNGSGCTVDGDLCGVTLITGSPRFLSLDTFSAAQWIEGTTKHGLVFIGQICRTIVGQSYAGNNKNHLWYGPTQDYPTGQLCPHGQTSQAPGGTGDATQTQLSALYIYDPTQMLAVANGSETPINACSSPTTDCADLSAVPSAGGSVSQLVSGIYVYGGAWYDSVNKLLFVSQTDGENNSMMHHSPIVHVFSVNC